VHGLDSWVYKDKIKELGEKSLESIFLPEGGMATQAWGYEDGHLSLI